MHALVLLVSLVLALTVAGGVPPPGTAQPAAALTTSAPGPSVRTPTDDPPAVELLALAAPRRGQAGPRAVPVALSTCTLASLRRVTLVHTGINVDRRCQRAYVTSHGRIVKVWRATTGKPGYRTRAGHWRVYRRVNRWSQSSLYPGAWMYRPLYFSGGQAIHGSVRDSLVTPWPASHGCVRLWRRNVDWLWAHGYARIGTRVYVF